ncbi:MULTISPECIES: molybdate ABC transporter permease subunit [unclassified Paenibacillus]|uniref:molybdate ABC transporter permease subunit n=1 Tax=unclassified Paenibacillus TaxID=185978 RepID=UPI00095410F5|nr:MULTISPECIES: molybdate ABC transporter permease subunit [unclassified Paenibacillus]ASS67989.1 molybdate ABC transporter permease subunit [Paenibacillus sp. RUD330]SIR42125.1 molybdate transport system permease protein [Paenibacillus sp. RU4X]SIR52258.1 molybdate transport system permease protein [Paenibacillus sp. RU4T]
MPAPIDWQQFWPPVILSLKVALLASVVALAAGTAAARLMSRSRFRGKLLLETAFLLPLVLPPTVVGFVLLVALGRRSFLGKTIEAIFSAPLVFTPWAAVVAAVVVSFPLVYQTMKTGFAGIEPELEQAARSAGASEGQVLRHVALPLAARSLLSALLLGFARSLGEFGATLMIAGNIPGITQTVPTAIYVAVDAGRTAMAWAWTAAIILISFLLLLFTGTKPAKR